MKKILYLIFPLLLLLINACVHTRVEEDVYTKTLRDTVETHYVKNAPGNRDGGVIYPSSRTIERENFTTLQDSIITRKYPDFIRLGFFEAAGIFGGSSDHALGLGIFGVYPDFGTLDDSYRGESSNTVPGGIYRVGIMEKRLRWFRDAKNWTYGFHGFEAIIPDARIENAMISIFPFYLRKRYFLREEIPYIAFTPTIGIGYFPSQYINLGATFDIGSIGGLNLRAYAGVVGGLNSETSPQIQDNDYVSTQQSLVFPYAGLGISVLDFLNRVPETEREWKYYEHSSWEVGLLELGLISTTEESALVQENAKDFFNGFYLKFANASVALPWLDYRLFAGTSLLNIVSLDKEKTGIGILPLRLGYWLTLIDDNLTFIPMVEYNYFPSTMLNINTKVNLRIFEYLNISFNAGYATGNNNDKFFGWHVVGEQKFSGFYGGFGFTIYDRVFFEPELRYFK